MDGGIGEAALLGAAMGGGSSLLRGQDPLQGILLGGLTGGAGAGIGSLLPGATALPGVATEATNLGNQATSILGNAIGNPVQELQGIGALGSQATLAPSLANMGDLSGATQDVAQSLGQDASQSMMQNPSIVNPSSISASPQLPIASTADAIAATANPSVSTPDLTSAPTSLKDRISNALNLNPTSYGSKALNFLGNQ